MIAFFGASVTLQKNGYAKRLSEYLEEDTKIFGYGGMHLNNAGICYIDDVLAVKPSFCFIDFFSTVYVEESKRTIEYLDTIVYKFSKANCKLIFLFFYREDKNLDKWYSYCKKYLKEKGLSYIDVYSQSKDNIQSLLKDFVHTNQEGSKVYAEIIYKEFKKIKKNIKIPSDINKTDFIDIKYLKVEKVFKDKVLIEGNAKIIGILNTIGPFSGVVRIQVDNKKVVKEKIWDQWCYYNRKHFNLSFEMNKFAEIKVLKDNFDTSECKYNLDFQKRKKSLILHKIFYVGTSLELKNISDSYSIPKLCLFIMNYKSRIIQIISNYFKG